MSPIVRELFLNYEPSSSQRFERQMPILPLYVFGIDREVGDMN